MDRKDGLDEKMDRYLQQEMGPEELKQFQAAMAADDALRAEVELQTEMKAYLEDSPENELRRNLQKLSAQYQDKPASSGPKRLWYLLLLIPILGGLLWWASTPSTTQATGSEEPAVEQSEEANPEQNTSPQDETAPIPEAPAPTRPSGPIAANFAPNPALEFLLDNNARSNGWQMEIQNSQQDVSSAGNEMTPLQFSAILQGDDITADQVFKLHLFDNDAQRYADFDALHSFDLALRPEGAPNTYALNLSAEVQLKPGLYYQILEDFETEEILWAGKFMVRPKD